MKKTILFSAATILALLGAASAQHQRDDDRGSQRGGGQTSYASAPTKRTTAPLPNREHPAQPVHSATAPAAPANNNAIRGNARRSNPAPAAQPQQDHYRSSNNNNRGGSKVAGPNYGRGPVNYSQYHRNFNAPNRFRAPSYRRPPGWYSHRWVFGERLPSTFFSNDYWISDYDDFDLMPPPFGTVWVRYGDDALLVDRVTGEVIQVEYSTFY